jgi:uncharacterized protein
MNTTVVLSLLSGLLFGLGLLAGGMTDPAKVKAFLDIGGRWDPSLALVMGAAVAVAVPAFVRARRQVRAWSGAAIELPSSTFVDTRLLLGGVLFGVGWGLAGFCPGPALVAAASGLAEAGVFVLAMLLGMVGHDRCLARR